MNDQVASAIRTVLKVIGGYLIAKGLANDALVETISGSLMTAGGAIWSYWHHTPPEK